MNTKKPFLFSGIFILVSFVLVAGIYVGFFYGMAEKINTAYDTSIQASPAIMKFSASKAVEIKNSMTKYGPVAGVAFGLIFIFATYVLYGLMAAIKLNKTKFSVPLAQLIISGSILFFAYNLAFDSGHSTALSSGIVFYIGYPLFYTFIISSILFSILVIASFLSRKNYLVAMLFLPLIAILSGCDVLSGLIETGCVFVPGDDAAHCYQEAAVGSNDETKCEKVPLKEMFKDTGSNPPKDKCYYQVAENKKDPQVCKNIKGGTMSYTVNECAESVIYNTENDIKTKLDQEKNLSPEEMTAIQDQLTKNQKMLEMVSDMTKNMHDMNRAAVGNLR